MSNNKILKIDNFDSFGDIADEIHKFKDCNNFNSPQYIELEFEMLKYVVIKEWQERKSLYEKDRVRLIELGCNPSKLKPFPEPIPMINEISLKGATIYGIPIKFIDKDVIVF